MDEDGSMGGWMGKRVSHSADPEVIEMYFTNWEKRHQPGEGPGRRLEMLRELFSAENL